MTVKLKDKLKIDPLIVRFITLFFVLVLIFSVSIKASWVQIRLIDPYAAFLARLSASLLEWLGYTVKAAGPTLSKGTFYVQISRGCDGLEATVLLISAILAYPATWFGRLAGAFWGMLLIFVLNIGRIVALCLIGIHLADESFDFYHVYVSQFAVIAITMVFWVYWAGRRKPLST